MGELGTRLREARESRGISFEQAEKETRIRRAFLQALEEERYEALPSDVYARGFIRNYGRYLGLDAEELLALHKRSAGASMSSIPHVLNEPLSSRSGAHLGSGLLIVVLGALVVALAGWYAYQRYYLGVNPWPFSLLSIPAASATPPSATAPATQPPMPSFTATAAIATEQPTAARSATPVASPTRLATATQPPTTAAPTSTSVPTLAGVATSTATVDATAVLTAAPTTVSATPTPAATIEGGVQVQASVVAATYLEVTLDGERVFTGLLDVGAERSWSARSSVRLRIGNAAGLRLIVNSVAVDPLGNTGEVVEVTYTPDSPGPR